MATLKEKLRKIRDEYVVYGHLTGRGESLTSIFTSPIEAILIKGGMIILLADKLFGIIPPFWFLIALWVFQKVIEYLAGYADQRYLKVWEKSEDWKKKNVSRWDRKQLEGIQENNLMLKELTKKNERK